MLGAAFDMQRENDTKIAAGDIMRRSNVIDGRGIFRSER
jgi:hypothetical protein